MRLVVNMYLRAHDNTLPLIEPLPINKGLKQLLVADVNVLIGEDIFDENAQPFDDIICVLGKKQRDVVINKIAIAETEIRARLQCRVPARRNMRFIDDCDDAAAGECKKDTDAARRRKLDFMLMEKVRGDAEVAAGDAVMRIMAITQSTVKEPTSSIEMIRSIMKELDGQRGARFVN